MGNLLILEMLFFIKDTPSHVCEGAWFAHGMHVEVRGQPWVPVLASHLV